MSVALIPMLSIPSELLPRLLLLTSSRYCKLRKALRLSALVLSVLSLSALALAGVLAIALLRALPNGLMRLQLPLPASCASSGYCQVRWERPRLERPLSVQELLLSAACSLAGSRPSSQLVGSSMAGEPSCIGIACTLIPKSMQLPLGKETSGAELAVGESQLWPGNSATSCPVLRLRFFSLGGERGGADLEAPGGRLLLPASLFGSQLSKGSHGPQASQRRPPPPGF
mmetsp:Transcript_12036/g.20712  ORF Transcript_12036/g.20712 Transcript_12036/m.20712 type:complete len:228 (-) Transcript_12036:11-694(-)